MLYRYIYLSSATEPMSDADIEQILAASRRNNTPAEITGMLMYHDGHFLQILEGPKDAVRACVSRIKADPRHDTIFRLQSGPVPSRAFPDWRMGFARPADLSDETRHAVVDLYALARPESPSPTDDRDVRTAIRSFLASFRFLRAPLGEDGAT
ncbi:MAG: BLUF domain-containing protein [Paracoccaceae bacterium]|jgi:hypothetical protein|nr:BLUF domain-containing protein [Paracoccaceae bacterium]